MLHIPAFSIPFRNSSTLYRRSFITLFGFPYRLWENQSTLLFQTVLMKLPELLQSTQSTLKFTDACKTKHVSYIKMEDINHAIERQRHHFAKIKKFSQSWKFYQILKLDHIHDVFWPNFGQNFSLKPVNWKTRRVLGHFLNLKNSTSKNLGILKPEKLKPEPQRGN